MRRLALIAALVIAACSAAADTANTSGPLDVSCEEPPVAEMEESSGLAMTVAPNPAHPRETVSLAISSAGLPEEALGGVDARWECWSGSEWAVTHAVYRGFGDNPGQTIRLNTEFQIRVPSIGLDLDEGYPIVIPEVEPGVYRIQDEVIVDEERFSGFVLVEVVAQP